MAIDTELEDFKRLDLREYAASLGYELDRRESSRASSVMRAGANKIVIKRNPNGHFVYFEVHDDADNGTIIDFVQRRKRLSLGLVRKELRPWVGRPVSVLPLFLPLHPAAKNRAAVEREYSRMQLAVKHPYLEKQRDIPPALLASSRFVGRVRIDQHGNAVFPHFDQDGLSGYELKNVNFTGFAPGGSKAIFLSHEQDDDNSLVLAESAIDALSYAALFSDQRARYGSIGGEVSRDLQPGLIKLAVTELPPGSSVIAAMDADKVGRKLAAMVQEVVREAGRPDITFRTHLPETEGRDWNDQLREQRGPFPIALSPPLPGP